MRKLITIAICFITIKANSQLSIKNETSEPISITIGWYSEGDNFNGYVTKGWWNIEPGFTIEPGLYFTSDNDHFYYYAKGWSGNIQFLVSDGAFEIKNADMQYVKDKNPNYYWVNFKRKDVSFDFLEERKYTLRLTE